MLRKMWCATTALVLCVSAGMAAQETSHPGDGNLIVHRKPGPPARPGCLVSAVVAVGHADAAPIRNNVAHRTPLATFNNFSKDKNAEFLSWYGFAVISSAYCYYYESASHYCFSEVAANAIPITGTGAKVKRITVPLFSSTGAKTNYNVGIYSATPSGLPGNLELAGGSTTASDTELCCTAARTVNVDITLQAGEIILRRSNLRGFERRRLLRRLEHGKHGFFRGRRGLLSLHNQGFVPILLQWNYAYILHLVALAPFHILSRAGRCGHKVDREATGRELKIP